METNMSYSMMIDRKEISNVTETRKMYTWIDDAAVNNCYKCNDEFGMFYRKHHCRVCGRIFCYLCSSNFISMPEYLLCEDKGLDFDVKKVSYTSSKSPSKYLLPKYLKNFRKSMEVSNRTVRVCDTCTSRTRELDKIKTLIEAFELVNLDIQDLRNIRLVCKTWCQLANYYLSKIREIQYYLPDHKYSFFDKKVLWNNRKYLTGHSKWLLQLLKSITVDYDNIELEKLSEIMKILEKPGKMVTCRQLMCSRNCKQSIDAEDCLELLTIKITSIKEYAIRCLDKSDIYVLNCYLPYLTHYMRYENTDDSMIGKYLIKKCIKIDKNNNKSKYELLFVNDFYWQLQLGLENEGYEGIYKYFNNKFRNVISDQLTKSILQGHKFSQIIENLPKGLNETRIREYIQSHINKYFNNNSSKLAIPLCPFLDKPRINIGSLHKKNSATEPLLLPLSYNFGDTSVDYNVLYKFEDIRKDQIIMNIITLIDNILKDEEGLNLGIVIYSVRPITSRSGLIEIVPNCDTIYNIKEKKKFTLLNYIMEHNRESTINEIRRRFMKSCAAYCIITYLLGIGDRHLDNIMITESGILFHIDYSYILGYDAKPLNTAKIRITPEMIDVLGGENGEYYGEFKILSKRIYNCLRRHVNLFINILSLLAEIQPSVGKFNKEMIKTEILKRFMPGEETCQAEIYLDNHINHCSATYGNVIEDYIHYYYKEQRVTKAAHGIYDSAGNIFSNALGKLW